MPNTINNAKKEMVNIKLDALPTKDILVLRVMSIDVFLKKFSKYFNLPLSIPLGKTDLMANNAIQNDLIIRWSANPTVRADMLNVRNIRMILNPLSDKG